MLRVKFDSLIAELGDYYGKESLPSKKKADKWYQKVERMAHESIEFLFDKITDKYERFPLNLPSKMWEFYPEWKAHNPDLVQTPEYNCQSIACHKGFIHYWVKDGLRGRWQRYTARCGHCMIQRNEKQIMFTEQQIEANGYKLSAPHNDRWCQAENDKILTEEGGFNPDKWRKGFSGSGPKTFVPFREVIEEEIPF